MTTDQDPLDRTTLTAADVSRAIARRRIETAAGTPDGMRAAPMQILIALAEVDYPAQPA